MVLISHGSACCCLVKDLLKLAYEDVKDVGGVINGFFGDFAVVLEVLALHAGIMHVKMLVVPEEESDQLPSCKVSKGQDFLGSAGFLDVLNQLITLDGGQAEECPLDFDEVKSERRLAKKGKKIDVIDV